MLTAASDEDDHNHDRYDRGNDPEYLDPARNAGRRWGLLAHVRQCKGSRITR